MLPAAAKWQGIQDNSSDGSSSPEKGIRLLVLPNLRGILTDCCLCVFCVVLGLGALLVCWAV
jgi:hypothetical protein